MEVAKELATSFCSREGGSVNVSLTSEGGGSAAGGAARKKKARSTNSSNVEGVQTRHDDTDGEEEVGVSHCGVLEGGGRWWRREERSGESTKRKERRA
jgi:hypothetical protein